MASKGNAHWDGNLKEGRGEVTVGDGTWSAPYSFKSRFEGSGEGTNPEELIGAAHAACYSMALANICDESGHPAEHIATRAKVTLETPGGEPAITRIELEVEGTVPGIDEEHFVGHAEEAKAGCPVSKALAGVPDIELKATLKG
jgi:osmotically inducible protein OsmC